MGVAIKSLMTEWQLERRKKKFDEREIDWGEKIRKSNERDGKFNHDDHKCYYPMSLSICQVYFP